MFFSKDSIGLGPCPADENPKATGYNSPEDVIKQAQEFKELIETLTENFNPGCRIKITRHPHDFGYYVDVQVFYTSQTEANFAYFLETHAPVLWDSETKESMEKKWEVWNEENNDENDDPDFFGFVL